MATRSTISYADENGIYFTIYCHFDGDLSTNGRILLDHYQDIHKIKQLIELGDISILDKNIGGKIDFDNYQLRRDNKQVLAYERDRNEEDTVASRYTSLIEYKIGLRLKYDLCEFHYLFKNDQWLYKTANGRVFRRFTPR
jgi:hypothetical protein